MVHTIRCRRYNEYSSRRFNLFGWFLLKFNKVVCCLRSSIFIDTLHAHFIINSFVVRLVPWKLRLDSDLGRVHFLVRRVVGHQLSNRVLVDLIAFSLLSFLLIY